MYKIYSRLRTGYNYRPPPPVDYMIKSKRSEGKISTLLISANSYLLTLEWRK